MRVGLEGVEGLPTMVETGAVPEIGDVLVVGGLSEFRVVNVRWFVLEVDDNPSVPPSLQPVVTLEAGVG